MRFYSLDTVTPPADLPVTVAEFIEHARLQAITVQRSPAMLERQLAAATKRGEEYCRRSFMEQTLKALYLSGGARPDLIQLPRGRVLSVTSVGGTGGGVIDPAAYTVDLEWGTITFSGSGSWPSSPVTVTWVSGYGPAATDVPEPIKEGILEYATTLYGDRRGSREVKATADVGAQVPPGVEDLWSPFQIVLVG